MAGDKAGDRRESLDSGRERNAVTRSQGPGAGRMDFINGLISPCMIGSQRRRPGGIPRGIFVRSPDFRTARGQFCLDFIMYRTASATMQAAPSMPVWLVFKVMW